MWCRKYPARHLTLISLKHRALPCPLWQMLQQVQVMLMQASVLLQQQQTSHQLRTGLSSRQVVLPCCLTGEPGCELECCCQFQPT